MKNFLSSISEIDIALFVVYNQVSNRCYSTKDTNKPKISAPYKSIFPHPQKVFFFITSSHLALILNHKINVQVWGVGFSVLGFYRNVEMKTKAEKF